MKTFRENFKLTNVLVKKVIKKEGLIKYYLYYIMKVLLFFSLFLSPFMVSKWKLAKEIKEEDNISITGLFESATDKGYFHILVANLIKLAIFISIFLVIAAFGGILFLIGYGIYYANPQTSTSFPFFFLIPAVLLSIIFIIIMPFVNVPNSYIGNEYPSLTPGRILKYSFYSFKNGGKMMMFKVMLFEWLTKLLYLALSAGIIVILLFTINSYIGVGLSIIIGAILLAIYLLIAPRISLISTIMRFDIYNEIVFVKNSNKLSEINFVENDIIIRTKDGETLNSLFKIEEKKNNIPSYENTLEENLKNQEKPDPIEVSDNEIAELKGLDEEIVENDISEEPVEEETPVEETIQTTEDNLDLETKAIEEPQGTEEVDEKITEEPETPAEEVQEEQPEDESKENEETKVIEEVEPQTDEVEAEEPQTETEPESVEEVVEKEPQSIEETQEEQPTEKVETEDTVVEEEPHEESAPEPESEETVEESQESEEDDLEAILNSIPEKESQPEEQPNEEISDDELDDILNSIPEKETKSEETTEEISDNELDDILNSIPEMETITEEKTTENISDNELEELLNSIPEVEEEQEEAPKKKTKKTTVKKEKKTTKKKKEE